MARNYSDEFVHQALELAAVIGFRPAAARLEVPEGTVRGWTRSHEYSERWAELRRQNAPKWRERAAISMEELVDGYAEAEADLLKQLLEQREDLEPRDIATALRSVAVAKGVTADHVGKLRGQPTQVTEININVQELEKGITKLLQEAQAVVDGSAEEITEALPAPEASPDQA